MQTDTELPYPFEQKSKEPDNNVEIDSSPNCQEYVSNQD